MTSTVCHVVIPGSLVKTLSEIIYSSFVNIPLFQICDDTAYTVFPMYHKAADQLQIPLVLEGTAVTTS